MKTPRIPLPADLLEYSQALEAAFAGRVTIGVPELAALIPMHRETIAKHIAAGNLVGRLKGLGRARRYRIFTISDVARFLNLLANDAGTEAFTTYNAVDPPVRFAHGMNMIVPRSVRNRGR